jgi:hypothetical protein
MKAKIYYSIGDYDDTIIIEGSDIDDLREKCDAELQKRGASYTGSEIIEE